MNEEKANFNNNKNLQKITREIQHASQLDECCRKVNINSNISFLANDSGSDKNG